MWGVFEGYPISLTYLSPANNTGISNASSSNRFLLARCLDRLLIRPLLRQQLRLFSSCLPFPQAVDSAVFAATAHL